MSVNFVKISFFSALIIFSFSFFSIDAFSKEVENENSNQLQEIIIDKDIQEKKYDYLISSLFSKADKEIEESVYLYAEGVDRYIKDSAEEVYLNMDLVTQTEALIELSEENSELSKELEYLKTSTLKNIDKFNNYLEGEGFLIDSIVYKYDLYTSLLGSILGVVKYNRDLSVINDLIQDSKELKIEILKLMETL